MSNLTKKFIGLCCCLPAIMGIIWGELALLYYILNGKFFTTDELTRTQRECGVMIIVEIMLLITFIIICGIHILISQKTTLKKDMDELIKNQLKKTLK